MKDQNPAMQAELDLFCKYLLQRGLWVGVKFTLILLIHKSCIICLVLEFFSLSMFINSGDM